MGGEHAWNTRQEGFRWLMEGVQNGRQGENKNLASANEAAMAEHAGQGQQ